MIEKNTQKTQSKSRKVQLQQSFKKTKEKSQDEFSIDMFGENPIWMVLCKMHAAASRARLKTKKERKKSGTRAIIGRVAGMYRIPRVSRLTRLALRRSEDYTLCIHPSVIFFACLRRYLLLYADLVRARADTFITSSSTEITLLSCRGCYIQPTCKS